MDLLRLVQIEVIIQNSFLEVKARKIDESMLQVV